jgi:ferredoxin
MASALAARLWRVTSSPMIAKLAADVSIGSDFHANPMEGTLTAASRWHSARVPTNRNCSAGLARSGVAAHWKPSSYRSILELAEACDVPVRWSCRSGLCHSCESGLVSGEVTCEPEPLDKPAEDNVPVCCSQPIHDVVMDL